MTIEERFQRIEHVTAGLAEERRKDREEDRQLWSNSQRQIDELGVRVNELTVKIAATNDAITRFADEGREADQRIREEFREADRKLQERIDSVVSAIGKNAFQVARA